MIPIVPPEVAKDDPTLVIAEAYKELPVDRSAFVGQIPKVVGLIPKDNFGAYVERKLFIHNGGHAISAYLGYRKGYEFIYQAVEDREIHITLRAALDEVGRSLIARHKFSPRDISDHIEDLIKRFKNKPLGDTIFRVGRDPIRKLGPNDRLVGGAKIAYQYGIVPDNLSLAIAAALSYGHPDDAEAEKLQEKIEKEGLDRVLEDVCQVEPKSDLGRLIKEKYKSLSPRSGRV
jgi:mannitol-1-phosphate 5-dehydrogenase